MADLSILGLPFEKLYTKKPDDLLFLDNLIGDNANIVNEIFAPMFVDKLAGIYYEMPISEEFKLEMKSFATMGQIEYTQFEHKERSYKLQSSAAGYKLTAVQLDQNEIPYDLNERAVQRLTGAYVRLINQNFHDIFLANQKSPWLYNGFGVASGSETAFPARTFIGGVSDKVVKWSDSTNATPISDIRNAQRIMTSNMGGDKRYTPTWLIVSAKTYEALASCSEVRATLSNGTKEKPDAFAYEGDELALARILGVERITVMSPPKADPTAPLGVSVYEGTANEGFAFLTTLPGRAGFTVGKGLMHDIGTVTGSNLPHSGITAQRTQDEINYRIVAYWDQHIHVNYTSLLLSNLV